EPADLVLPLAAVLVATTIVFGAAWVVYRNSGRAALATSLIVVVVFAFGRVLDAAEGTPLSSGRLLAISATLLLSGLAAIFLVRRDLRVLHQALSIVTAVLVVIASANIVAYEGPRALGARPDVGNVARDPTTVGSTRTTRDIYYIVVEDLGSPEILRKYFGLTDEHAFEWFDQLGFRVATDSATNYGKTIHMLASTMNMTYLDDLAEQVGTGSSDYHPLFKLVDNPSVARFLKSNGYRYVHIGSWWDPTEESSIADLNYGIAAPSDFNTTLLGTTIFPEIVERLPRLGIKLPAEVELKGESAQYEGAVFAFSKLEELPRLAGPKFVFAHILIPHEPFVFNADGSRVTAKDRAGRSPNESFLQQSLYTIRRLKEVATKLLAGPEASRPIVILQTDEGPNPPTWRKEGVNFDWTKASQQELEIKYPILNAFYLPGLPDAGVYPGITTVNTFRLVLGKYFGADLPLLPDRLFIYRDKPHPYELTDITERLRPSR
ncbi:MAG TPA: hypothetical protein VGJ46_08355, partial [Candidatus Limnocylindrales bacterium]